VSAVWIGLALTGGLALAYVCLAWDAAATVLDAVKRKDADDER
jgi:hypothetical protein